MKEFCFQVCFCEALNIIVSVSVYFVSGSFIAISVFSSYVQ